MKLDSRCVQSKITYGRKLLVSYKLISHARVMQMGAKMSNRRFEDERRKVRSQAFAGFFGTSHQAQSNHHMNRSVRDITLRMETSVNFDGLNATEVHVSAYGCICVIWKVYTTPNAS